MIFTFVDIVFTSGLMAYDFRRTMSFILYNNLKCRVLTKTVNHKEVFGFRINKYKHLIDLVLFFKFHRIEAVVHWPGSMEDIVLSLVPGLPRVWWPLKVVSDTKDLGYCRSDNAWFPLKDVKEFNPANPDEVEKWKSLGSRVLKKKPTTLKAFLLDIHWAIQEKSRLSKQEIEEKQDVQRRKGRKRKCNPEESTSSSKERYLRSAIVDGVEEVAGREESEAVNQSKGGNEEVNQGEGGREEVDQDNGGSEEVDQDNGGSAEVDQGNGGSEVVDQGKRGSEVVDQGNRGSAEVDKDNGGSEEVDQDNGGSEVVDQGNRGSEVVDQGNGGSEVVDQGNGGSEVVDQGNRGSAEVDQGNGGSEVVDQDNGGSAEVDQGNGGSEEVDQCKGGGELVDLGEGEIEEVNQGNGGGELVDQGNRGSAEVDQGNGGSEVVDQGNGGSEVVDQGNRGSAEVDQGNGGSEVVDQDNGGSAEVDQGNGGSEVVDQGKRGSEVVDQGNRGSAEVDQDNGRSEEVDQDNGGSEVVDQGNRGSEVVDQGNGGSEVVDQSKGGSEVVDQGNRGSEVSTPGNRWSEEVNQGKGGSELVDLDEEESEVIDQSNRESEEVDQCKGGGELVDLGEGEIEEVNQGNGGGELVGLGNRGHEVVNQGKGVSEEIDQGKSGSEVVKQDILETEAVDQDRISETVDQLRESVSVGQEKGATEAATYRTLGKNQSEDFGDNTSDCSIMAQFYLVSDSDTERSPGTARNKDEGSVDHVSDSLNEDSETSEIFPVVPAISQHQEANIDRKKSDLAKISEVSMSSSKGSNISAREEEEDCLPENIVRDINNPGIYVKKVMKSNLTKDGKMKKSDRVYNSYHPCPLCMNIVTNFSHHLLTKRHATDEKIKELLTLSGKERKQYIQRLRLKGANMHNVKVLEEKKGEIFLLRRSSKVQDNESEDDYESEDENAVKFNINQYGPCPLCYGWILLKSIKRHVETCIEKNEKCSIMSKSSLVTQSDILAKKVPEVASTALVKEVFEIMQQDEVSSIAKNDPLIISLGNQWMQRNAGNKVMRKYYTSSVMRLSARLKMEVMKLDDSKKTLNEYLVPSNFENVVKAALICSKQDILDEEDIQAPSNAIKLGHDLKRMVSAKLAKAVIDGKSADRRDAEDFLKLMELEWSLRVNKLARITLTERSFNVSKPLPLPDDITKLVNYLTREIEELDLECIDASNFRSVAMLVLARVTLYNRRRSHEVQALRLSTFASRKTGVDEVASEMRGELTPFEEMLLQRQEVVVIRGKTGKGVPVIIPPDVKLALQYLTNPEVRKKCGFDENQYVFANSHVGVLRAYDAIRSVTSKAGLQMPHLIRTTNMRKYFATMLQALATTDSEKQWVLDHLGHTMDVHKIHYRQTSDVIERVDVAKLLLIQDFGLVGKFKNMRLKDIQITELLDVNEEITRVSGDAEPGTSTEGSGNPMEEREGCTFTDDYIPDEEEEEEEEVEQKKKAKRKKPAATSRPRQRWTEEEVSELQTLFAKEFASDSLPGQRRIEKMMEQSKKNNGHIYKRQRDTIKKKISNMLITCRRK